MSDTGQRSGVELLTEAYRDAAERDLRNEVARLNKALEGERQRVLTYRRQVRGLQKAHDRLMLGLNAGLDRGATHELRGEVHDLRNGLRFWLGVALIGATAAVWGWLV